MSLCSNQAAELLSQWYLKKKYKCPILILSIQIDVWMIKKQTENLLMLDTIIPKTCKKRPSFSKALSMVFDKFWFLNFVDTSIEKFAGINFAIAVTQTIYFWHSVFILQIVNFLVLLFWNVRVLDRLRLFFLYKFIRTFESNWKL